MNSKLHLEKQLLLEKISADRISIQEKWLPKAKTRAAFEGAGLSGGNLAKIAAGLFTRYPVATIAAAAVCIVFLPRMLIRRGSRGHKADIQGGMVQSSVSDAYPTRTALLLKIVSYLVPVTLRFLQSMKQS